MPKREGVQAGLDMHIPCSHEDGLESDPLFADIAFGCTSSIFRALADIADSSQIVRGEAILIALDNDTIWVILKRNEWKLASLFGLFKGVILGILQ
jgi:hypothetical protein